MKTLIFVLCVFFSLNLVADVQPVFGHKDGIWKIRFSRGGEHFLTTGGDGKVRVWWVDCYCALSHFNHDTKFKVYDADFFPDGRIISTSLDGSIYVWNMETGEKLKKIEGHTENSSHVRVSRDGALFYTAGADDYVRVRDSVTYEEKVTIKTKSPVGIVPLPGNRLFTVGLQGALLWNLADQSVETEISPSPYYFAMEPLPNEENLVLVGGNASQGAPLQIIDTTRKEIVQTFEAVPGYFWQLAVSPNGEWIAGSSYQSKAYVWERATGKLLYTSDEKVGETLSLAFFPEGRALLIGAVDGRLHTARF